MASYTISGADGTTRLRNQENTSKVFHHFEIKGHSEITTGSVKVEARQPGAPTDRLIDVGLIDIDNDIFSIDFVGVVQDWIFTATGLDASLIYITVTSISSGKSDGGISPFLLEKLESLPTESDLLSEGLALGQLYAKDTKIG